MGSFTGTRAAGPVSEPVFGLSGIVGPEGVLGESRAPLDLDSALIDGSMAREMRLGMMRARVAGSEILNRVLSSAAWAKAKIPDFWLLIEAEDEANWDWRGFGAAAAALLAGGRGEDERRGAEAEAVTLASGVAPSQGGDDDETALVGEPEPLRGGDGSDDKSSSWEWRFGWPSPGPVALGWALSSSAGEVLSVPAGCGRSGERGC